MGLISFLSGGQAVPAVTAVGNVIDGLFTSDDERMTHEEIQTKLAQAPNLAQVELNKVEASHRSRFIAGWRPFIGWVGGIGLLNMFLINPWIQWITGLPGPNLPEDTIFELVIAMLGMGALRTVEKLKGKAK